MVMKPATCSSARSAFMRLPLLADGERDLRLPVDLLHAARDLDFVEGAGAACSAP